MAGTGILDGTMAAAGSGKYMNVKVGQAVVLTEEQHKAFQETGVMPATADGATSPIPVPYSATDPPSPRTPPAESDKEAPPEAPGAPVKPAKEVQATADPPHLHVDGQRFAVVSMVVPPLSNHMALKVRGVFADEEKAGEHARELMKADPNFDIYVVSMYNWLVLPLPDDLRGDVKHEYVDDRLGKIMGRYHSEREKFKRFNEQRALATKEAGQAGEAGEVQADVAVPTEVRLEAPPDEVVGSSSALTLPTSTD